MVDLGGDDTFLDLPWDQLDEYLEFDFVNLMQLDGLLLEEFKL